MIVLVLDSPHESNYGSSSGLERFDGGICRRMEPDAAFVEREAGFSESSPNRRRRLHELLRYSGDWLVRDIDNAFPVLSAGG